MRKVSFCFASVFFLFLTETSMKAQAPLASSNQQGSEQLTKQEQPADRLQLRKDQQVPYREIIKRYAFLVKDVRKSVLSKEEKVKKLNELELAREAEIKTVLSEDQFTEYLKMKEENRTKFLDMRKK